MLACALQGIVLKATAARCGQQLQVPINLCFELVLASLMHFTRACSPFQRRLADRFAAASNIAVPL